MKNVCVIKEFFVKFLAYFRVLRFFEVFSLKQIHYSYRPN